MPVFPTHQFNTGNPNLDNQLRKLARAVRSGRPAGSGRMRISVTPTGTIQRSSPVQRRYPVYPVTSGGGTTCYPFTPTLSGNIDDGYTVSFYPGVMNGLVPSSQFTAGANTAFTLSSGINYITLNATTNGQQVTAVDYGVSATPPAVISTTAGACPTIFYWLLAIAAGTSAGGFTLLYSSVGNVIAQPKQVFVSAKASPQYGTESYDRWWTWQTWQLVNL